MADDELKREVSKMYRWAGRDVKPLKLIKSLTKEEAKQALKNFNSSYNMIIKRKEE